MTNKEAYAKNPDIAEFFEKQCKSFMICLQAEDYCDGIELGVYDFVDLCRHLDLVLGCRYYGIEHYDEYKPDGVTLEKPHYHLVIVCTSIKRVSTVVSTICSYFHIDKFVEGKEGKIIVNPWIGVEAVRNEVLAVQYLIHATEKSRKDKKKPYEATDIITNAPRVRDCCLAMDNTNPIETYLPELVEACDGSVTRMLDYIPATLLRPWLSFVNTLCLEYKSKMRLKGGDKNS